VSRYEAPSSNRRIRGIRGKESRIDAVENHEWTRMNTNKAISGAGLPTGKRTTIQ
jgi:hypothetical protein